MRYVSSKTYGHDIGLSCAFRQWRAQSHCRFLHGYAIAVRIEFEADFLDACNWVIDFGGLKELKASIVDTFDHKLLVARDDPNKDDLAMLAGLGLADVLIVEATGCECFAQQIFDMADTWLNNSCQGERVSVKSVEVKEHGANSAIYFGG